MVLRFVVSGPTSRDGFANHLVNLLPVFARQRDQYFRTFSRIANRLRCKTLELRLHEEHDEYIFADDHARGGLICKLCVECVTELSKELDRFLQIPNRQ